MNIFKGTLRFIKAIYHLFISTSFITMTLIGNVIIFSFAIAFYELEKLENPLVTNFIDALWWSYTTATTVGYGDIVPITEVGRVIGIVLMLVGTALFVTYTALFSQAILTDDFLRLKKMEKQEHKVSKQLDQIQEELKNLKKYLNS